MVSVIALRNYKRCSLSRAAEQTDPNLKQDFLELEESWLFLARSFKFNERLGDSSDVMNRKSYKFVQSLESFVLDARRRKY